MARVLIVDDEEDVRMAFRLLISGMGHEVFEAKDAEEAKAAVLREKDIDVALVDRVLPGKESGLEVLEFIGVSQPLCQTVLVSGYPTFDSASEALRLSAFDYLTKPVKREQLSNVIDAAVKEKSLLGKKILDAEKNRKGYEALKTKQEMLQHDMRSLIIGITGFTNLLINRTSLDDIQMEYCRQIQQCSTQLENMVSMYLDIANLEDENFEVEKSEFDILDTIMQSRKALRFLADEKNVDISLIFNKKVIAKNDVLFFFGNRVYFQNAINNLLKNAIEASPQDLRVKVKVKDTGGSISISIHNWGTVPEDVREIFFKKYASSGKKGGIGLGTYMASLVAKVHNGRISVHSSEETGTEVSIVLPSSSPSGRENER